MRDTNTYDRVEHRDLSPHSISRNSIDRNPPHYINTTQNTSYTPHSRMLSDTLANPVATLPIRPSKWSVGLVDPLDIYDKLLHNSLCIYEGSTSSASVNKSANVGQRATTRDDRNITTSATSSIPNTNKYGYSIPSSTNSSRKRAISPVNSVSSDRDRDGNYYTRGGDNNRYSTAQSTSERSTRPRISDYSDNRRNDTTDSRISRHTSSRFDNRDNKGRRSRSPSRSESVARSGEHPFRTMDRAVNRTSFGTPANRVTECEHTSLNTTTTTRTHSLHTMDKPNYALITPSQLCTTFRTPSVSIQYSPYPTILQAQDLYVKYPRLYVPNDFLRVTVDIEGMLQELRSGLIGKLREPVNKKINYVVLIRHFLFLIFFIVVLRCYDVNRCPCWWNRRTPSYILLRTILLALTMHWKHRDTPLWMLILAITPL